MNENLYTEALQEFTPLSLEEKKKKILKLLDDFGNAHLIFWEITQDIQTLNYTDKQYIMIYQIILKSMYEVEKNWLEIWIKKIEQLYDFLMQLRAQEAEDTKKEWDIDVWLNKVLSKLQ